MKQVRMFCAALMIALQVGQALAAYWWWWPPAWPSGRVDRIATAAKGA